MKKIFIVSIIAFVSQTMVAMAGTGVVVPQAVSAAFAARFPDARVKKWSPCPQGFMAMFKHKGKKEYAYYAPDGTWKATETAVSWTWNLPDAVRKAYKDSDYAAWKVEHIKRVDQPDEPLYILDVNSSPLYDADHSYVYAEEWVIFFNQKGELVRKYQKG
jgi:hypothetical protein